MKKIFTLVAMAFVAVCANAQAVVAEIDWTQQTAYYEGVWYDNSTAALSFDNGLVIDCTADGTGNYWEPQVPMIAQIPLIEEGGSYQVVFTVDAPSDGEIRLDFCSWDTGATKDNIFAVQAGEHEYTIDFPDYPLEATNAMIFYQCGKMPGKHVIKKVTVIDLDAEGPGEGGEYALVQEIDWTAQSAYYDGVWYDNSTAALSFEDGLVITCTADGTGNYWEPQVPMIAQIPLIEEGGSYQVVFAVDAPSDGTIRLDFCSWDTGATKDYIFDVQAGLHEYVIDFDDYPLEATNAMIFYQCGKMPGKHVIKYVKVYDKDATGIEAVKADQKFNGAIYNLAGQKVNENYKGVVIQNGKKFIQK